MKQRARDLRIGPPSSDGERDAYGDLLAEIFSFPRNGPKGDWLQLYPTERLRLARRGGRVVGGLYQIECAQFFGGRAVPTVAVAGVGTLAEERGGGVADALVRATVVELAARGVPLSSLYPSTIPLYRRNGYEQAADHLLYRLPVAALPRWDGGDDLEVERFANGDREIRAELAALQRRIGRAQPGMIERDEFLWRCLIDSYTEDPTLFRVREGGVTTGWLGIRQAPSTKASFPGFEIHCRPLEAETPRALSRLLGFLRELGSMAEEITLSGPPRAPWIALLKDHKPTVQAILRQMIRVTHPASALQARGYPAGLTAALELEVIDEVVPDNSGRYRLTVAGGAGEVERGAGSGVLRVTARGLAALFTGYLTGFEASLIGLAEGPAEALRTATEIFAGPAPYCPELY